MTHLALDIGGANLKAADARGFCRSVAFPLWKDPAGLTTAIVELLRLSPPHLRVVATMTGELADCFQTKREGVRCIIKSLIAAVGREVKIYLLDGRLVSPDAAIQQPLLAAASNWHVLARLAGRYVPHAAGLLLDIGSTTCDVIPLIDGRPAAVGLTDPQRLVSHELVYTGVQRSPVCSLVRSLPWRNQSCPVAQELFSTTWDAYLTLGDLPEEPNAVHTADGRPATIAAAHDRLARSICADREMFSQKDAQAAARAIELQQSELIEHAVVQVLQRLGQPTGGIVVSGQGEFLARRVIQRLGLRMPLIGLSEILGPALSRCAPAHALAMIADQQTA